MRAILLFILSLYITGCKIDIGEDKIKFELDSHSTIHLKVNGVLDTVDVKAHAFTIVPYGNSRSESIQITDEGNYYLSMQIDRPTKGYLELGNDEFIVIILPNDTSHVRIDISKSGLELAFSGTTSEMNKYYLEKAVFVGHKDIRGALSKTCGPLSTYNSIKNAVDSITEVELNFLKSYSSNSSLPQWFLDYERSEIVYAGAGFKVTRPARNQKVKLFEDQLPDNYFIFLNDIEINNPNAIFSSIYFQFLDGFFLRDFKVEQQKNLPLLAGLKSYHQHIINQSKKQLTGEAKNIYHKLKFTQAVRFFSEVSQIDSLANSFQLIDYYNLIPHLQKGDVVMDFKFTDEYGNKVSFRGYKDKILYINYWATWCAPCIKRIPELNNLIGKYEDNPSIAFMNICVDSDKDKFNSIRKKFHLKGINLFADYDESSKLRRHFNISAIPQYVLIGKDNVLFENHADKAPNVTKKIEELIKIKTPHNNGEHAGPL